MQIRLRLLLRLRCLRGRRGFLKADPLGEIPQDHDVSDALHPPIGHAYGLGTLDKERIRLPDEYAFHEAVVDVNYKVVYIAEKNTVVRVDLQADELGNLFEQLVTIPMARKQNRVD